MSRNVVLGSELHLEEMDISVSSKDRDVVCVESEKCHLTTQRQRTVTSAYK